MTTKEIAEASGKDINIVRKVLKEKGAELKRGRVPQDFNKKMTDSVLKALEKVAPPGKRGRPAKAKDEAEIKPKTTKKVAKVEEKKEKPKAAKKAEPKKAEVKEKAKASKPKAESKKKVVKPKKTMPLDEDEEEDDIVVPSIHDGVPDSDLDDEDDLVDMDSLSEDDDGDDEDDEEE